MDVKNKSAELDKVLNTALYLGQITPQIYDQILDLSEKYAVAMYEQGRQQGRKDNE